MVACTVCRLKRGLAREEGVDTPMHTMAGGWKTLLPHLCFPFKLMTPVSIVPSHSE